MAINIQKLLPSSTSSPTTIGDKEKLIRVKTTVISIENVLKGTLAFEKKQLDVNRKKQENKKSKKREEDLEKKESKKESGMSLPSLPKTGFLSWIRNFITNVLVGYFVVRLIKYLPQLQGVLTLAGKAFDGVIDIGGKLLNGLATFIDWGYRAYDATRGFIRNIGGDNTLKLFDKFTSGFDTFLNLVLGYNALFGGTDIIGKTIGKTIGSAFGRLGIGLGIGAGGRLSQAKISQLLSKGIQKIPTTSQAQANLARSAEIAGLSPRQRAEKKLLSRQSNVQDLIGDIAQPLKPTATSVAERISPADRRILQEMADPGTSLGKAKRLQKSLSSNAKDLAAQRARLANIPFLTDDEMRIQNPKATAAYEKEVARQKLGPGVKTDNLFDAIKNVPSRRRSFLLGTRKFLRVAKLPIIGALLDFGLSWALGESPGRAAFRAVGAGLLGAVGGVIGSAVPVAGSIIGGAIGGAGGDYLGGLLYDVLFGDKKPGGGKTQGYANGGIVTRNRAVVGGPTRRGVQPQKPTRRIKEEPQPSQLKLGSDVGGDKAIKKMFPEPAVKDKNKQINPYGYVQESYKKISDVSYFGPLFGIAIKTLSGDRPDSTDYRNASIGLSNYMIQNFGSVGMPGFANGGMVKGGIFTTSEDLTKVVEKSLEEKISGEVDKAINDLKRRLGLEPISGVGGQAPSPVTGPVTGLQGQAKEYYEYLVSKGVSPNHAMGLILNIARESSFQSGVEIIDVNGKPSGGLFQWNGGRFTNMVKAVPDWKTNWKGQLDYAMQESDPTSGGFAAYKSQNFATPMEAATWWLEKWERGDNVPRDVAKMQKILDGWIKAGMKQSPTGQFQFPTYEGKDGYKPKTPGLFNAVQYITGDPSQGANYDYAGHGTPDNYHDHIAFATEADKEKAKKALRAAGIEIGSELRPGDPGYHGANLAIDIPGAQWRGSGAIGQREYDGSARVRSILGLFGGGSTGKGGLTMTHPGEYIIDKDSVDSFGQPFFDIINQVENNTQRANASMKLMNILKNYIPGYDPRSEQTIYVPIPQPQMIPVPISSGGGGGVMVQQPNSSRGMTDILNSGS